MTEQQIMREMDRKGIHSITIQSYLDIKQRQRVSNKLQTFINPHHEVDNLEYMEQRIHEVIVYGRDE